MLEGHLINAQYMYGCRYLGFLECIFKTKLHGHSFLSTLAAWY